MKTNTDSEQGSGYQRGRGEGEGKEGQLYGDGWKLYFSWGARCSVYTSEKYCVAHVTFI